MGLGDLCLSLKLILLLEGEIDAFRWVEVAGCGEEAAPQTQNQTHLVKSGLVESDLRLPDRPLPDPRISANLLVGFGIFGYGHPHPEADLLVGGER